MGERSRALPADLGGEFSVGAALSAGVTPGRLRGNDLLAPFWGVRMSLSSPDAFNDESDSIRMLRSYACRMAGSSFFSHESAGLLWGIPLPRSLSGDVHVSVLAPSRAPAGRGVRGHQLNPAMVRVGVHRGLRVSSPSSTWAQLGATLDVRDLVAAGDALMFRPRDRRGRHLPALATRDQLAAAVSAGRRSGVDRLRVALEMVRVGAASRPESHLRLEMADVGLPEPDLDYDVWAPSGDRIGWTEFAFPRWKVLVEYEGDHHRTDIAQWNRDILKHDLCRAAGWDVVRLTAAHLYPDARRAVERVRAALVRAGWSNGA